MRVTFLGTGTSRGIPVIGCSCNVCTSLNPRNCRLRCSVLIQSEDTAVVIDTSVDFRIQMLQHQVRKLDAIVYTHHHADHILGLDDVYPFNIWSKKTLPVYASSETIQELRATFRYLFDENPYPGTAKLQMLAVSGPFEVGDLLFEPVEVYHGTLPILGYRVGNFAYLTDVSRIPDESLKKLEGVRVIALDGLRYKRHSTHFSLREAAEVALNLGVDQAHIIHMCHDVDHDEGNAFLPDPVSLAYDGLVLEI